MDGGSLLLVADLDGDGDTGSSTSEISERIFTCDPNIENPVKIWMNDFDENGTIDKIITPELSMERSAGFNETELTEQIPSLKKKNLKHQEYATKSIQELFHQKKSIRRLVKQFNYALSCIAINDGNGKFTIPELPCDGTIIICQCYSGIGCR